MTDIYKEVILENWRFPKNFGKMKNPDLTAKEENALCGDSIEVYLKLKKNKISEVKFQGKGCIVSLASASLLTENIKNKSFQALKRMSVDDLTKILGIELSPARLKCAELPLIALKKALDGIEWKK